MYRDIAEQHAEEAAFLWQHRSRAARAPHYALPDLGVLDDRVEAHLDGLRVAGDIGWDVAREALSWQEPGELFTAAVIAVESRELERIALVLDETRDQTPLTDAFTGALAWVDAATLTPILPGLLSAAVPATLRRTGVIGCAAQRRDPGDALAGALADQDAALRAAGLWAAGVLGRRDLRGAMTHHLQDDDEACRFWSAWSTVRLGEDAALPALWSFVEGGGERAEAACQLAVMRMSAGEASVKLDALDGDEGARVAVIGAGAFGDIARVPWLIERMAEPQLARIAGEAFTILTGAPIAGALIAAPPADHVAGPTEHPDDDDVALDPDEHRRWPNADAVAAWWQQHASDYVAGVRHFLGQPVADQVLHAALRLAPQTVRALAALKLAAQSPGQPLFPVDAPGFRQLAALR